MEDVSITWENPYSLEEPYKTWAEDFIINYIHKGFRPKHERFDMISRLLTELATTDHPKVIKLNTMALGTLFREFESWCNKGRTVRSKKHPTLATFKAQDFLPKFESYSISGDTDPSLKMMDLSGVYWEAEYLIGDLIFKNNEEGPGLEFNSYVMGTGPKTCPLEGFEAKEIGIKSHLAYNSDEEGKPKFYFLPGTGGQVYDVEKNQILV